MIQFLKLVADDVYGKFNGRLENVAVVFPNKRAGLFFNQYLLENSGNAPMWSPRYMTISELFRQKSDLTVGDPLLLVSKLYKEYIRPQYQGETVQEYEKSVETLDSFYYWGEMLIKDFDDIDKNLANAKQLFSNIKELRELGTAKDTLTPEQQEAIGKFFDNFNPQVESDVKRNFLNIWERLFAIYTNFKESLKRQQLAYEGMLYREVVENVDDMEFEYEKYIFVGFNVLNGVEDKLFSTLNKRGKALFYWDYDNYYIKEENNEAGHFMRKNLRKYPNALAGTLYNNLRTEKRVTVVSANSNSIQARYLSQWLDGNLTSKEVETAVVLCDEAMLEPVLHTIPEKANGTPLRYMNVTMGYPISNTPIFTLVKLLVELQTRGWSAKEGTFTLMHVCNVLKHPYIIQSSENSIGVHDALLNNKRFYPTTEEICKDDILARIFTRIEDNKEWMESIASLILDISRNRAFVGETKHELYDKLFSEAILKVYTQVQRMIKMLDSGELDMQQATIGRLLVKMLSRQSMPFHGEPVVGLQIMGLLETRNLDFKNVIMLSVNEGNIPKNSGENSFIPYNLRRAFGLTLSEHRDAIYAYNFYRLIQRAESVTLVYSNASGGKMRSECSRYILQLLGSNLYDIKRLDLSAEQSSATIGHATVKKNSEIANTLRRKFDTSVSSSASLFTPSAINRYLRCKLNFFYYYVLNLKPMVEVNTEMAPNDFGSIFHKAAEEFYKELTAKNGDIVTAGLLDYYIDAPALLYKYVNSAFVEIFFKGGKAVYNGEQYISRGIVHRFLLRLLRMDRKFVPFRYIGSEQKVAIPYSINSGGRNIELKIGGTIDRIDVKGDTINIVDYKTGRSSKDKNVTLDAVFNNEVKSSSNYLQSLLYSVAIDRILNSGGKESCEKDCKVIDKLLPLWPCRISPSLLYLSKGEDVERKDFTVEIENSPVEDISTLKKDYTERLNKVIAEIFDETTPFNECEDSTQCSFCDYKAICGK